MPIVLKNSVGKDCVNVPREVHEVKRRLQELGFGEIVKLTREAGSAENQLGFFNRESVMEVNDQHDYCTSWLRDWIIAAGASYRDNYLNGNRFASLITLNDFSLPLGGASRDHASHQIGMSFDLVLPWKDGTARRPSVTASDSRFDKNSAEAMIVAFVKASEITKVPFKRYLFAKTIGGNDKHKSDAHHNDHVHFDIGTPEIERGTPPTLTGEVNSNSSAEGDALTIAERLVELGFNWAKESSFSSVAPWQHQMDDTTKKRRRNGKKFLTKGIEPSVTPLQWAIRLFASIVEGDQSKLLSEQIVPSSSSTTGDPNLLDWLYAKNAPQWVKMPEGTIEVDDGMVRAIMIFQAMISGRRTIGGSDGKIDIGRKTHLWLDAKNAPKWEPLTLKDKITNFPGDAITVLKEANVSSWLNEALQKIDEGAISLSLRSPAAFQANESMSVSGLVASTLITQGADAAAFAKSIIEKVGDLASVTFFSKETPVPQVNGADVKSSTTGYDYIEIHTKPKKIELNSDSTESILFFSPPDTSEPNSENPSEFIQRPRIGFVTDEDLNGITNGTEIKVKAMILAYDHPVLSSDSSSDKLEREPVFQRIELQSPPDVRVGQISASDVGGQSTTTSIFNSDAPVSGVFPIKNANGGAALRREFVLNKYSANSDIEGCTLTCSLPPGLGLQQTSIPLNSASIAPFGPSTKSMRENDFARLDEATDDPQGQQAGEETDNEGESIFNRLETMSGTRITIAQQSITLMGTSIKGRAELILTSEGEVSAGVHFDVDDNPLSIELGSPLALLTAKIIARGYIGTLGAEFELKEFSDPKIKVDLFDGIKLTDTQSLILNNVWDGGGAELTRLLEFGPASLKLGLEDHVQPTRFTWDFGGNLSLNADFFKKLFPDAKAKANSGRKLASLQSGILGGGEGGFEVSFNSIDGGSPVTCDSTEDANGNKCLAISCEVRMTVTKPKKNVTPEEREDVIAGPIKVRLFVPFKDGRVQFVAGAFRCDASSILTVDKPEGLHTKLSDLVSLHVPKGTNFKFGASPQNLGLKYEPPNDGSQRKLSLRIPASDKESDNDLQSADSKSENTTFAFELESFDFKSSGIDLKGTVKSNAFKFLGAGADGKKPQQEVVFTEPLSVNPAGQGEQKLESPAAKAEPVPRLGEIEFKDSRLVAGSLQMSGKLPYFDNATGTLSIVVSEDPASKQLSCLGTFDVTGLEEFHIAPLYARCHVKALSLSTKYISGGKWDATGHITGQVVFAPPEGGDASDMGFLANLFSGVTVSFEDMKLNEIGVSMLKIDTPPKTFDIADILKVDMRGIQIGGSKDPDAAKGKIFKLLGDIGIKKIPGIDSSLSFGGISLLERPGTFPKFDLDKISAQLSTKGGFSLTGSLTKIDNEQEIGFAGSFLVQTDTIPGIGGMVKLTRIEAKDGSWVPSLAVNLERDFETSLFAGFFLREMGVGLGLRQALRGLNSNDPKPLQERIMAFVGNPLGLPVPRNEDSWERVAPKTANSPMTWMLVGSGLITYGSLPKDKPHVYAGSILLSVDQNLETVLATNAWLFASPEETRRAEFAARPVARGAIALSVRERRLFACFRTLSNPAMGKDTPKMLSDVMSQVQTTMKLSADSNGFLMEVGWPWDTRVRYQLGKYLKGEMISGYRFGIYRDSIILGLNLGIKVELEASRSMDIGPAEARLIAKGNGELRASLAGAIERGTAFYVVGHVSLNVSLHLGVEIEWSIRVNLGFRKVTKTFRVGDIFKLSVNAYLAAALQLSPGNSEIGFRGEADVAVSLRGFNVRGKMSFGYNEGLIGRVQNKISSLAPAIGSFNGASNENASTTKLGRYWQYHYCRLKVNGEDVIRVLLFPRPGQVYNSVELANEPRFIIPLNPGVSFLGIVGTEGIQAANSKLSWSENLEHVVVDAESPEHKVLLGNLLSPQGSAATASAMVSAKNERSDPRIEAPAGTTTDEFSDIAPNGLRTPHLANDTKYDSDLIAAFKNNGRPVEVDDNRVSALVVLITKIANKAESEDAGGANALKENLKPFVEKLSINGEASISLPRTVEADELPTGVTEAWLVETKHNGNQDFLMIARVQETLADNSTKDRLFIINTGLKEPRLDPAMLFAELLEFMRDTRVKAGERVLRSLEDEYQFAPHMRLVLEFSDSDPHGKTDPVPSLIDLKSHELVLGGETNPNENLLRSVLGVVGTAELPEYDIIAGNQFQSDGQICLTWEFLREDPPQLKPEFDPNSHAFAKYIELEKYVVTRENFSQTGQAPKTKSMLPFWIKGAKDEFIRPQFQFIDNELDGVREGDLLLYRVEAHATERILASTLIQVQRRTIKRLSAPTQSLALQHLQDSVKPSPKIKVTLVVPVNDDWLIKSDSNAEQPGESQLEGIKTLLKIRYRFVTASTLGSYGFGDTPSVEHEPSEQIPPRSDQAKLQFLESAESRPIPWTETLNFEATIEWKLLDSPIENGIPKVQALIAEMAIDPNGLKWHAHEALELFVGIERKVDNEPLQRSSLTKFRHALWLPVEEIDLDSWTRGDFSALLQLGNQVDAFEQLPTSQVNESGFLSVSDVAASVNYPGIEQSVTSDERKNPDPPTLVITWQHDKRGRIGIDGDSQYSKWDFNPAIGYRLHYFDRFDPRNYDAEGNLDIKAISTEAINVLPEAVYRSRPSSILPKAQKVVEKNSGNEVDQFHPDWRPTDHVRKEGTTEHAFASYVELSPSGSPTRLGSADQEKNAYRVEAVQGYAVLDGGLYDAIATVLKELDSNPASQEIRCRVSVNHPHATKECTWDEKTKDSDKLAEFVEQLNQLSTQFNPEYDPYGWASSELLGRSCEVHFLDSNGVLPFSRIKDALGKLNTEEGVSIYGFLADDDKPLNLVRFAVTGSIPSEEMGIRLLFAIEGLPKIDGTGQVTLDGNKNKLPSPVEGSPLQSAIDNWIKQLVRTSNAGIATGQSPTVLMKRFVDGKASGAVDTQTKETQGASGVNSVKTLPISPTGEIRHEISLKDCWSHHIQLAIEPVRRYDRILRSLSLIRDSSEEETNLPIIDEKTCTVILVDRTQSLAPSHLIATPLPGSIQAMMLRHPASFASTSSAENAAYSQYHGQSVYVERRVAIPSNLSTNNVGSTNTDRLEALAKIYTDLFGEEELKKIAVPHDPVELFTDHPLVSNLVPATDQGIYGIDRYVFPDLPPYYEYRVHGYSSAGRVTSQKSESAWVSAIVESDPNVVYPSDSKDIKFARQFPRVFSGYPKDRKRLVHKSASLSEDNTLSLEFYLQPLRMLLPEELRAIWDNADDEVDFDGTGEKVKIGWLPDLELEYQVFLRTNSLAVESPVFEPFMTFRFGIDQSLKPIFAFKNPAFSDTSISSEFSVEDAKVFVKAPIPIKEEEPQKRILNLLKEHQMSGGDLKGAFAYRLNRHGAMSAIDFVVKVTNQ